MSDKFSVVRARSAGVPVGVASISKVYNAAGVGGMDDTAAGVGGMLAAKAAGVRIALASGIGSITAGTYFSGSGFSLVLRSGEPSSTLGSSSRAAAARAKESFNENAYFAGAEASGVGTTVAVGPDMSMKVFLTCMVTKNTRLRTATKPDETEP